MNIEARCYPLGVLDRSRKRPRDVNELAPAVAAGVSDHVWKLDELIELLEEAERTPIRRGSHKRRAISD